VNHLSTKAIQSSPVQSSPIQSKGTEQLPERLYERCCCACISMDGQGVEVAGLHTCAYSHAHTYGMPTPFNRNVRHPDLERAILGQKIRRPVESGRCCGRGDRQEENSYTKTTAPPDSPGMRSLRYRRRWCSRSAPSGSCSKYARREPSRWSSPRRPWTRSSTPR